MIRTIVFVVLSAIAVNHFALCEKSETAMEVRSAVISVTEEVKDTASSYLGK